MSDPGTMGLPAFLVRKAMQAAMKDSCGLESKEVEILPTTNQASTCSGSGKTYSGVYLMLSDFVCDPLVQFEVFPLSSKTGQVQHKGELSVVEQIGQRLQVLGDVQYFREFGVIGWSV